MEVYPPGAIVTSPAGTDYEIIEMANHGAMAVAFKAQDPRGEPVFLKAYKDPAPEYTPWFRAYWDVHEELLRRMAPIGDYASLLLEHFVTNGTYHRVLQWTQGKNLEHILAETGTDKGRFPTAGHLASWARPCPGNNESAGKRRTGATGRGNPWLCSALVEAGWGAA